MATYAIAAPLPPEKSAERWAFVKEIQGPRAKEHAVSRLRAGLTRETVVLQKTPQGEVAIGIFERPGDAAFSLLRTLEGTDPFDRWFAERVAAIHGITAPTANRMPRNEPVFDWRR